MTASNLQITIVPVETLIPFANNAKLHSDGQVAQIAASIREFGFNNPVLIDPDNVIIAGHGRVLAARKLGLLEVPCIRLGHLSEAQRRAYVIADNRLGETGGGWDMELLKAEIDHLANLGEIELTLTGFEASDLPGDDLESFGVESDEQRGQGDYVRALRATGVEIIGLEFFRRKGDAIDVEQVNRMVDQLVTAIRQRGRFDAVVMDYVLNSVDSQQAEEDVLNTIDALCKPGGTVFFSGRSLDRVEEALRHRTADAARQPHRFIEFLDENGLTALYRKGSWFFQKFHSEDDIRRFMARRGWTSVREVFTSIGFNIEATTGPRLTNLASVQESIAREFNLPMNRNGRRLGRDIDILDALIPCLR